MFATSSQVEEGMDGRAVQIRNPIRALSVSF